MLRAVGLQGDIGYSVFFEKTEASDEKPQEFVAADIGICKVPSILFGNKKICYGTLDGH